MSLWSRYLVAESLEEALDSLAESSGATCPVAGGTDLLIELSQARHPAVETLVDVTRIPELGSLERRGDELFIGAAVSVARVAASPLVREHAAAVAEACAHIGGPQVRTTATLGGNVAHALPAADGMIALAALDAVAEVAGRSGTRRLPILELFLGPGRSVLRAGNELLIGFSLPLRLQGEASAFSRIMRPQGVALPILNAAVWLARDGERVRGARLVVAPSGPVPLRSTSIERLITGRIFDEALLGDVRRAIPAEFSFRSSRQRAGADYRYSVCPGLVEEVISAAWRRADGPPVPAAGLAGPAGRRTVR